MTTRTIQPTGKERFFEEDEIIVSKTDTKGRLTYVNDVFCRVGLYSESELLGQDSIAFISFLESAGVLPPEMREMVIDRASAVGSGPVQLDDLKVIVLMVFWSLGEEPDALILDELFVDPEDRLIH